MLTSEYHPVLEEIGRLEAERDALTRRIEQLRSTLPRETVMVSQPRQMPKAVPLRDAPVQTMMSPVVQMPDPEISDHAAIRYLERQFNFDFDKMKAELLTDTVKLAIRMGAQSVKAHGGRLMIRGNKATTFIIPNRNHRHKKR
jgi:hypothetical protein